MKLPNNIVHQCPSGRWTFVGHVDAVLAYVTKDGASPSDEQIDKAQQFGPALAGLRPRTWPTQEAALATLEEVRS